MTFQVPSAIGCLTAAVLGDETLSRLKEKDCEDRHAGKEAWKGSASLSYFVRDKGQFETYIMQLKLYVM